MTTSELIDRYAVHPIYALLTCLAHELVHVLRCGDRFRWVRSSEALTAPAGEWDRLGTNLYNHVTGESLGAVIDVDGSSHGNGLTPEQLEEIKARQPDYVSLVTTSTSGTGLHIYILWTAPIKCSPEEHRQLGKRTALKMEADVGLPYRWVDVSGNILWTSAKDAGPGAFQGTPTAGRLDPATLPELPPVPGKQGEAPAELNDQCRQLMEYSKGTPYVCRYVAEIGATQTHKGFLKHAQQYYPGNFTTDCRCTDPSTANIWLRWNEAGHFDVWGWGSDSTWEETSSGYYHCTFGKAPSFQTANAKGVPESSTCVRYTVPDLAVDAVRQLTGTTHVVPDSLKTPGRQFDVVSKSGVIQLRAHKSHSGEPCPEGWCDARGYVWIGTQSADAPTAAKKQKTASQFIQTFQDKKLTPLYRYTGEGVPVAHTREQAISVARSQVGPVDAVAIIDAATANPVELVCEAFQPVIQPGKLNVGPNFLVKPAPGRWDTCCKMLLRLGDNLTPALIDPSAPWASWVRKHRITSGGRYLLWWIAYLVQHPTQRLPIVALVGGRDVGKSSLGDFLETLWDKSGTSDAGELLRTKSQFTGPVSQSVLGRIEDCDVSKPSQLLRLTPWVTAPRLLCEHKNQTAFAVENQLHLLLTTNNSQHIPIADRDCRFVVIEVGNLGADKDVEFADKLEKERAAFLHHVLHIKLPMGGDRYSRLALPDVSTDLKQDVADSNRSPVEVFADSCLSTEGTTDRDFITTPELFDAYQKWCEKQCKPRLCDSPQELIKQLSGWFTARGIQVGRTNSQRGRKGVKLTA